MSAKRFGFNGDYEKGIFQWFRNPFINKGKTEKPNYELKHPCLQHNHKDFDPDFINNICEIIEASYRLGRIEAHNDIKNYLHEIEAIKK